MPGFPALQPPPSAPESSPDSSRNESPGLDSPEGNAALIALFARIPRKWERVVLPLNASALDKNGQGPAFYCIHSLSGAGGTDFQHLAKLMPAVRFYGIQAPPTKMQDEAFGASVVSVADFYADALIKFQPKGPFLLGGWSAGAVIALEIAQILRARGRAVRLLAAIDAAPRNSAAALRPWHPLYLLEMARNLPGWIVRDAVMMKRPLHVLIKRGLDEALARVKAAMNRKAGKTDPGFDAVEKFMDVSHLSPVERAFMNRLYAALLSYEPKKYVGQVVAYEATTKPLLDLPQVGRVWGKLAPWSAVVRVTGTHLSILQPGSVNALARDLSKRIAGVWEQPGGRPAPVFPAIEPERREKKLEKKSA